MGKEHMLDKEKKEALQHLARIKGVSMREAIKLKKATEKIKKEVRKNIVTAIVAAFGFVIALVWRDAIQEVIDKVLGAIGLTSEAYFFRIISAIFVTIIAVIGILLVSRWAEKKEKEIDEES